MPQLKSEQAGGPLPVTEERDDPERRRQGAFFTPGLWAEEALRRLDQHLGPDWECDSILWDPACGTGNLTASRQLPNLVLTTLDGADLQVARARESHRDAVMSCLDFVNHESIPDEIERLLYSASQEGKRLVFLANPPYATAGNLAFGAAKKTSVAKSRVNLEMLEMGLGKPSQQLYIQFLFRCAQIAHEFDFKRSAVAVFSKSAFLTASSFAAWRSFWFERYRFLDGFLFRADEFSGVSSKWGVSFSLWSEGETPRGGALKLQLLRSAGGEGRLESDGGKLLYGAEGRRASDWARGPRQGPGSDGIQLKGGLHVSELGRGRDLEGHLGWLNNDSNDVYHSARTVWIQSAGKSSGQNNAGWFLTPENFERSLSLFSARKSVVGTWVNDKDEFIAPAPDVESTPEYRTWRGDALVYAAMHAQNTCSGARGLSYKDRQWSLTNELFWLPSDEVAALARRHGVQELLRDAECAKSSVPHLLAVLQDHLPLKEEAAAGWRLLEALLRATMRERISFSRSHPERQALCWDAGLFQLKPLFEEAQPALWEEFKDARAVLRARVREGVYRFGLLLR